MTTAPLALRAVRVEVPDGPAVRVLLDDVDLDVGAGEVVVVTGASGSGKSTMLAVAGLLMRPLAGDVLLGGEPTTARRGRARTVLRRDHVAIVYQAANLLPSLTAREQLELVGHIRGRPRRATRAHADRLLDELGLGPHAARVPAKLSGGERQRVGIARALMAEPTVLLADEPTAALDADLSAEVATLLAREARLRGLATVVVSHDDAPLAHADRHLHLAHGRLRDGAAVAG